MRLTALEVLLQRYGFDRYLMALVLTITLAALFPAPGSFAEVLSQVTFWAVALLFFLIGAKLSLAAIWAGADHLAAAGCGSGGGWALCP